MTSNRIRELREARGLTQEQLGAMLGTNKHKISRLENARTALNAPMAKAIAKVLETTVAELLGDEAEQALSGFADEAEPYQAGPSDPLARLEDVQRNRSLMRIQSNALDELGIKKGDVVLVDYSAGAVQKVKPLAPVIVQLYDREELTKATTLVRQYVPPNLLVTNSRSENQPPINMATTDAHIKGVIVSWHRLMSE